MGTLTEEEMITLTNIVTKLVKHEGSGFLIFNGNIALLSFGPMTQTILSVMNLKP